eukprot:RCo001589
MLSRLRGARGPNPGKASPGCPEWTAVPRHQRPCGAGPACFLLFFLLKDLYREGSYVVWPAFSSCTFDGGVAKKFFEAKQGEKAVGAMFILKALPQEMTRGRPID